MKIKKITNIISGLMLTIAILLISWNVFWSKFYFWEIQGEAIYNCPFEINIIIESEDYETTASEIALFLDDSLFTINKFDPSNWVFKDYINPIKSIALEWPNKWNELIKIIWTTSDKKWFKWTWVFGRFTITPLLWVDKLEIKFYNIGRDGDDSNIPYYTGWIMKESLTETKNLKLNLKKWKCKIEKTIDTTPLIFPSNQRPELIKIHNNIEKQITIKRQNNINSNNKISKLLNNLLQNKELLIITIISLLLLIILTYIIIKRRRN